MAERTHPELVPGRWKPGQSGNPKGTYALPPEIRALRKENMAQLIRLVQKYTALTSEQAASRLASPDTLQIEEMIQGVIMKAKEGDPKAFQAVMEIMCGKIPESDYDQYSEEDIQILNRIKEVRAKNILAGSGNSDGG